MSRSVDDAGQVRQERRELFLHLLTAKFTIRVLEAVVGHQVGRAGQFAFACGRGVDEDRKIGQIILNIDETDKVLELCLG